MMGGFADAINTAVIESLDVHQDLATQILGKDRSRNGFADIVYELIAKGLNASVNKQNIDLSRFEYPQESYSKSI
ncbi:MAG: hypothetical protein HRT40_12165 [Campylobacteraceae bacterium]|nr:hypothetical protein [Campylobacteraceae bacterium]